MTVYRQNTNIEKKLCEREIGIESKLLNQIKLPKFVLRCSYEAALRKGVTTA